MTDFSKTTFIRKHLQIEFAKKGIDIFAKSRIKKIVKHRRACVYLLREQGYKYAEIGTVMQLGEKPMNAGGAYFHYCKHEFEREKYLDAKSTEVMARQIFTKINNKYAEISETVQAFENRLVNNQ